RTSYWNSVFNLTATYRVDANIFVPYGEIQFKPIPVEKSPNYYRTSYWNSVFNLTATYRVDANIFVPYGEIQFKPIPVEKSPNY
ncbi:alpha-(1 3)-fucosyltransferase C, partial [Biomphalaria glabrata]